jgi:Glycosyltransferases involved in cell wall biogenesis
MSDIVFSIITVCYNTEQYVKQTIESILSQNFQNFELIILDDNSTDGSWKVISEFKDPRINAIKNNVNIGEYSNRNKGVELARGKYIIFIDGDDIMYFNALQTFNHYIKLFPDCNIFCAREYSSKILYPYKADPKTVYQFEFLGKGILGGNFTKILFRKSVIVEAGYFPLNITTGDTYLQFKIALYHNIVLINDGLTWWRKRKGNASDKFFTNRKYHAEIINYRVSFLNHPDCPLNPKEKQIAKTNIYGNYLRTLFRMIIRFQFKEVAYLCSKIKVPLNYYKSFFSPYNSNLFKDIDGDNPLHTVVNSKEYTNNQDT